MSSFLYAGEHEHTIVGYSLVKGIGDGEPIASERFTVGGHEWVSGSFSCFLNCESTPCGCWHFQHLMIPIPADSTAHSLQLVIRCGTSTLNPLLLYVACSGQKLFRLHTEDDHLQVLLFYPDGKRSSSTEGQVNQGGGAAAIAAQPHFPANEAQMPAPVPQDGQAVPPGPQMPGAAQPGEIRGESLTATAEHVSCMSENPGTASR